MVMTTEAIIERAIQVARTLEGLDANDASRVLLTYMEAMYAEEKGRKQSAALHDIETEIETKNIPPRCSKLSRPKLRRLRPLLEVRALLEGREQEVREGLTGGLTLAVVAEQLGVSMGSVWAFARQQGIITKDGRLLGLGPEVKS